MNINIMSLIAKVMTMVTFGCYLISRNGVDPATSFQAMGWVAAIGAWMLLWFISEQYSKELDEKTEENLKKVKKELEKKYKDESDKK